MEEQLKKIIGQCIGQASMQWEFNDRGGIYQSDDACVLLDETVDKIMDLVNK